VLTTLHAFSQFALTQSNFGYGGESPLAGLSLGRDGCFYGTTLSYGANTNGTIFSLIYPGLAVTELPGNKVLVSWPTNQDGFTLQVTTNLTAATWLTASPTPTTLNDQFVVTNNASGGARFYRLKK